MKSNYLKSVLFCGIFSLPFQASAQIPTTDIAAVAASAMQHALEIQQMIAQVQELERQFNQAKEQFDALEDWNIGNSINDYLYNNPELYSYIPTDPTAGSWMQIYDDMNSSQMEQYRNKYDLHSEEANHQEYYDIQLTNINTMEGAYRANNLRLQNLEDLLTAAMAAETPQQKQDIANRLAVEQGAIMNEANRLAVAQDLMAKQNELLIQQQNHEFNRMFDDEEE